MSVPTSKPGALDRRRFLRGSTTAGMALAMGTGGLLLSACDPVGLGPADGNGLRLPPGFTSRIIATTGQQVGSTGYTWHTAPDGGACFPLPDGGWSYVSNSETGRNTTGVGFVRFNAQAQIVGAGETLRGTALNCGGGATPWGTWLTCEEYSLGQVWECDPIGVTPGVARPAMGAFGHEAAACDPGRQVIYLTEDNVQGGFYRFVPTNWGNLASGQLQVLTRQPNNNLSWRNVPDPSAANTPTRDQVPNTVRFAGGEGCDLSNGVVLFTTKFDNKVWKYNPGTNTLDVIYNASTTPNGVLSGVDNLVTSDQGVAYVAEDGGNMEIVLVRPNGQTFPVVQVTGTTGSEVTGPAFNPAGDRLYFSSQRDPGRTYEVKGPWSVFTDPG